MASNTLKARKTQHGKSRILEQLSFGIKLRLRSLQNPIHASQLLNRPAESREDDLRWSFLVVRQWGTLIFLCLSNFRYDAFNSQPS